MIAVAVAAVILEGVIVRSRYVECRDRAAMLTRSARGLRRVAQPLAPNSIFRGLKIGFDDGRPDAQATRELMFERADYYDLLAHHYARAAGRPWLPIGSQPPEP